MKKLYIFFFLLFIVAAGLAQTRKLSVIGSSTAYGTGASPIDSSWVNRITYYYSTVLGISFTTYNIAIGGANCYQGMPSSYVPPAGRDYPQPDYNITKALQPPVPDVVIASYPTNNYQIYSISEILFCLQMIKDSVNVLGRTCYITTSQPRQDGNFPDLASRQKLKDIRDAIMTTFGTYAIDFYTPVANLSDFTILPEYSAGDGIHLNNAGHRMLFEQVKAKNILNLVVPVKLTAFTAKASDKKVLLKWSVTDESPGTVYHLQRSEDGIQFQTIQEFITTQATAGARSYEFTDNKAIKGYHYYRLEIVEQEKKFYSRIEKVYGLRDFALNTIRTSGPRTWIQAVATERLQVRLRLLSSAGTLIQTYTKTLEAGNNTIILDHSLLAKGIYWVEGSAGNEKLFLNAFVAY